MHSIEEARCEPLPPSQQPYVVTPTKRACSRVCRLAPRRRILSPAVASSCLRDSGSGKTRNTTKHSSFISQSLQERRDEVHLVTAAAARVRTVVTHPFHPTRTEYLLQGLWWLAPLAFQKCAGLSRQACGGTAVRARVCARTLPT